MITSPIEVLYSEQKCYKLLIYNRDNFLFLYMCVKSRLEKLRGHKLVSVMSHLPSPSI